MPFSLRKDRLCPDQDWISSDPVHLIVGPDNAKFVVHERMLTEMSSKLKGEVLGAKAENGTRTLHWPEAEPTIAAAILEYAYFGDFDSPRFYKIPSNQMSDLQHTRPDFGGSVALARAWERFAVDPRYYDEEEIVYDVDEDSIQRDALRTVGKVYQFAEKYEIRRLEDLCLSKLHRLMVKNQEENDILEFLEDCADDDCHPDLLDLAAQYATFKAELFKEDEGFRQLLRENASFAAEMFWCLLEFHHQHNTR